MYLRIWITAVSSNRYCTLLGIKGQYLLLDTAVINIRKYTAYSLAVSVN